MKQSHFKDAYTGGPPKRPQDAAQLRAYAKAGVKRPNPITPEAK